MPETIAKCSHKGGLRMTFAMKTAGGWQVRCTKCGRSGPIKRSRVKAIAAWNSDRPLRFEVRCPDATTNPTARFPSEEQADEYVGQDGCPDCEIIDRKDG